MTGNNLKPHLGGMNVGEVAAEVAFAAVTLDDDNTGDSSGNGDAILNPGETVELNIDLVNNGTGGVNDVVATLTSGHDLVTVTQPAATFGFMGSGETVSGQEGFVVSLEAGVTGGLSLPLALTATDGSRTWTSLVTLQVSGPGTEVRKATPASAINPGDTTTLEVEIANIGDLATTGVTATLQSDSHWITVTDPDGSYGPISIGGTGTNTADTFEVMASNECYPGYVATLTLDLVYAEGGTASLPVLVDIGSAVSTDPSGPDRHGSYAFDDTDTGFPYTPIYDWVEISPDRGGPGTDVGLTDFGRWQ